MLRAKAYNSLFPFFLQKVHYVSPRAAFDLVNFCSTKPAWEFIKVVILFASWLVLLVKHDGKLTAVQNYAVAMEGNSSKHNVV